MEPPFGASRRSAGGRCAATQNLASCTRKSIAPGPPICPPRGDRTAMRAVEAGQLLPGRYDIPLTNLRTPLMPADQPAAVTSAPWEDAGR